MTNQTILDDYRYLQLRNNEYSRNRNRWQFLYESYVGGKDYRDAGHLTRYQLESDGEYRQRLRTTPLDNHCASVISTYMSFLFREDPDREFYSWSGMRDVEDFLKDCDYEGRSFDAFMKDVATWSSVFGHCWVLMTKPNIGAQTLGQELEAGVRPYVNLITPLVVSDWRYERSATGAYELVYIKYIEEIVDDLTVIREWFPTEIKTWEYYEQKSEAYLKSVEPNQLGIIPAVLVYNKRSVVKSIGVSDINDIADVQKMIYNLTSENEQSIRMDGHPSLVAPPTAQLGSGAGALILLQEGSDPGLNPYYLEHSSAGVNSIHSSLDKLVESIDRMAFTGGVRGTQKLELSGVAMEVEFNLLAAKLSEKASNLELAEEQIWRLFGLYQGREWAGEIEYSREFNIRDVQREFNQLQMAKSTATSPEAIAIVDFRLRELLEDPTLPKVLDIEMEDDPETVEEETLMAVSEDRLTEPHIMMNPETGEEIEVMTNEQHLALTQAGWIHPGM
jgi:hypothetical protein